MSMRHNILPHKWIIQYNTNTNDYTRDGSLHTIEFHNVIPTQHKVDTVQCTHNILINEQHNTNTNDYIPCRVS